MNIKKILAITIVVLAVFSCLSVASAGWFDFLTGEQFLQGDDAQVKIPSNYTIDEKKVFAGGTNSYDSAHDDRMRNEISGSD